MHTNSSSGSENSGSDTDKHTHVTQRITAETTPPSVAVVEAVAAATDVDVDELPLLYEAIDPDALDALFAPKHAGTPRVPGQVRFTLAGCEVTVTADGEVAVRAPSSTSFSSSSASSSSNDDSRSQSKNV